jgi:hypothetical protein
VSFRLFFKQTGLTEHKEKLKNINEALVKALVTGAVIKAFTICCQIVDNL